MKTNRAAHIDAELECIRRANAEIRMRQMLKPGRGYRIGFWRKIARAIVRVFT